MKDLTLLRLRVEDFGRFHNFANRRSLRFLSRQQQGIPIIESIDGRDAEEAPRRLPLRSRIPELPNRHSLLPHIVPDASLPPTSPSTEHNMTHYALGPPATFELAVLHRSIHSPLSSPESVLPQFDWGSSSSQRSVSIPLCSPDISPTGSFEDSWEHEVELKDFDHEEENAAGDAGLSDIEENDAEWLPDSSSLTRHKAERVGLRNRSVRFLADWIRLDRRMRESRRSSHDS